MYMLNIINSTNNISNSYISTRRFFFRGLINCQHHFTKNILHIALFETTMLFYQ